MLATGRLPQSPSSTLTPLSLEYPISHQPFEMRRAYNDDIYIEGSRSRRLERELRKLLEDPNSPSRDEAMVRILIIVYNGDFQDNFNRFLWQESINLKPVKPKVIAALAEKRITLRQEKNGTICMTGEALVDEGTPAERIAVIDEALHPRPKVVVNMICEYDARNYQVQLTLGRLMSSLPSFAKFKYPKSDHADVLKKMAFLFRKASEEEQIEILNIALADPRFRNEHDYLTLSNMNLSGLKLSKLALKKVKLVRVDLTGADLRNSNLDDVFFENCTFEKTDLSDGTFTFVTVNRSPLQNCTMNKTQFTVTTFDESPFRGCVVSGHSHFSGCSFRQSPIEGTGLKDTVFDSRTSFWNSPIRHDTTINKVGFNYITFDDSSIETDMRNCTCTCVVLIRSPIYNGTDCSSLNFSDMYADQVSAPSLPVLTRWLAKKVSQAK